MIRCKAKKDAEICIPRKLYVVITNLADELNFFSLREPRNPDHNMLEISYGQLCKLNISLDFRIDYMSGKDWGKSAKQQVKL